MERPTVVIELGDDPKLARDIAAGGVFVAGCSLRINADCALVVRGPEEEIELAARVVYVDAARGAGLELIGFTPALRDHLTRLLTAWVPVVTEHADAGDANEDVEDAGGDVDAAGGDADAAEVAALDEPLDLGFDPAADGANAVEAGEPTEGGDEELEETTDEHGNPVKRRKALTLHERLRGLTLAQQIKIAQTGDPQERILLERYYNKNVWEPLLRNPRLTPPEVARIARMGTLPRVLLEVIVGNGAWLQVPEIRRALLANPRLGTDQILRVLRMLPKHELKLASVQTAYPYPVRDAAKRLIREMGGGG